MKVYFSKTTGRVIRIKDEKDSKPYCNPVEYRKNLSELNRTEQEEYNNFVTEENWKSEEEDRVNRQSVRQLGGILR